MKQINSILHYRWVLLLLIGFVIVAALLRGLVQSFLAQPAAQVLWWLRMQYLRVPQDAIWLVFILFTYLLFFASLRHSSRDQRWQLEDIVLPPEQALRSLTRLIENSNSSYARYRLCQKVTGVALSVLAERTGHPVHLLKTEILDKKLELPEEVSSYLREGIRQGEQALVGGISGLAARARVDPRLYKTLEFLENEEWMEHLNGHS